MASAISQPIMTVDSYLASIGWRGTVATLLD